MMRKQNKRRLGLIQGSRAAGLLSWHSVCWSRRLGPIKDRRTSADSSGSVAGDSSHDPSPVFKVGVAQRDITPGKPVPMWGYGARHDRLSGGVLDPLRAKALVIEAGQAKLAIVGMDLGRGPTPAMMNRIRQAIAQQRHCECAHLRQPHPSRSGDRTDRSARFRQGEVR